VPAETAGAHGPWWIPAGSPGTLGDPEIWIDEAALDSYGRGDAEPAVTMTWPYGEPVPGDRKALPGIWNGARIRFARHGNDLAEPVVYNVISRRWSRENNGRPYYIVRWPD
jgi:hypothetical protein